eukprot:1157895-Pelagomonas_calceolata.AAC.11
MTFFVSDPGFINQGIAIMNEWLQPWVPKNLPASHCYFACSSIHHDVIDIMSLAGTLWSKAGRFLQLRSCTLAMHSSRDKEKKGTPVDLVDNSKDGTT